MDNLEQKESLSEILNDRNKAKELLDNYFKSDLYKKQCENWDKICELDLDEHI